MKISISDLTTERKWRSALGLDEKRFFKLLKLFSTSYEELFGESIESKQADNPANNSKITTYEELLFFTLFSLKSGLTYDLLGLVTGLDGSNAKRNQELGVQILQHSLDKIGLIPKREFKNVAEFNTYFKEEEALIIDGVEQRMQRPSDNEEQKKHYSGKKRVIQ